MPRNSIFKGWLRFFYPSVFLFLFVFTPLCADCAFADFGDTSLTLPRERCSMRFVDAEVKDVLRLLAKEYRLNIIISERVEGLITLDFNQVPLEDIQYKAIEGIISEENPESSGIEKNVRQALRGLHPRYRIPVILKDIEGFTQEEIAAILQKPVGTIKARISRGRSYLKRELERALAC